jgi:hypothetical protein
MKKISNNENKNPNLNQFSASLNFAFCPSKALFPSYSLLQSNEEINSIIKECGSKTQIEKVLKSFRYFYICYCLKIEDLNQENKNYFYFQLFSQIGDQQSETSPVYGFYNNEEIISMIRDVNNMFSPDEHDKQIFESYVQDLNGNASEIIKLMQDWTSLKLLQFTELYFQDHDAIQNLRELLTYEEESKKNIKKTKKVPRKSRQQKNKK